MRGNTQEQRWRTLSITVHLHACATSALAIVMLVRKYYNLNI